MIEIAPRADASRGSLWVAFQTTYSLTLKDAQRNGVANDPVSEYVVQLLGLTGETHSSIPTRRRRSAQLEQRARRLAAQLVVAFATEPGAGGLPACLAAAERWGGFDWFRDRLEHHGFTRVQAWHLCLAFRRTGLLRAQPNRPYLDRRGVALAHRLLAGTGVHAHTVRDWEAALMLEADSRLAAGSEPAKLDAEIVTVVCAQLGS